MSEPIQVFMTAGDKEEAQRIAQAIVEQRLAACVQVLGPIYSSYWWEDELETAEEYLCLMKSDRRVYDELEAAIKKVHSYDTPEILAMPVTAGNPDYLQWLQQELKQGS